MSSALTSGMPPESSVASVRETCAVANRRASGPKYGSRRIAGVQPASLRRLPEPQRSPPTISAASDATISPALPTRLVEIATTIARRQRQLGAAAELAVEVGELRHDLEHDQPDDRRPRARTSTTG